MDSYRFWSVTKHSIVWNGAGTADGWKGNPDHGYAIDRADLASPGARAYWTKIHIPEKLWCSEAAQREFTRIVAAMFHEETTDET